jgi:hypothetical protein
VLIQSSMDLEASALIKCNITFKTTILTDQHQEIYTLDFKSPRIT